MRTALLVVQTATFLGLGLVLLRSGETRLAAAQFLLAGVTVVVYA